LQGEQWKLTTAQYKSGSDKAIQRKNGTFPGKGRTKLWLGEPEGMMDKKEVWGKIALRKKCMSGAGAGCHAQRYHKVKERTDTVRGGKRFLSSEGN